MKPVGELDGVQLRRVDSGADCAAFIEWLGRRRPVLALDTETTGLGQTDRIRLVQFGDAYEGWTIRWDRWSGLVHEVLEKYDGPFVLHNATFDLKMLHKEGIDIPSHRLHDTMVMAHCMDTTRPVGLKPLATALIDSRAGVAQAMLDEAMVHNKWDWATIPYEVPGYSLYAAMDTVLTARLYDVLYPQVMLDCPLSYDLERAFSHYVMRKELRGVRIDREYTQTKMNEFTAYVKQCDDWVRTNYGVKPGSDEEIIEAMQRDGLEFSKLTKSGKRLSLDKEVLEDIIETSQHPLAQTILWRRRAQKLASTYLKNFLNLCDGDGLLRPSVKSIGARTGRQTMSHPALHTLPRRSDNNPLAIAVRNCIVPREGNVLVLTDFDQIEMRLMAHEAGDAGLIAAFSQGDFFTNIARELYADPNMQKSDPRRQLTKNAMYALGYGAGARKIALTAGTSLEAVEEFLAGLALRFPGIRQLQRQVQNEARATLEVEGRAYTRSFLTKRRHYADPGKEYALLNYRTQGTAAEILKMKSLELEAAGVGDYVVLDVHDEVIADVPRSEVREVVHTIQTIMNDRDLLSVPLTAGTDFGYRWGDKGAVTLEEVAL